MARLTAEHFVDKTTKLLSRHYGVNVSLSMVLQACEANKGSLYHFFPGGKDELIAAVVNKMGAFASTHLRQCIDQAGSTAGAIALHVKHLVELFERPESEIGLPFLAIATTLGATSTKVRQACEDAVNELETIYLKQLLKDGLTAEEAQPLATFVILTVDGAILLARTRNSAAPLKLAAIELGKGLGQRTGGASAE